MSKENDLTSTQTNCIFGVKDEFIIEEISLKNESINEFISQNSMCNEQQDLKLNFEYDNDSNQSYLSVNENLNLIKTEHVYNVDDKSQILGISCWNINGENSMSSNNFTDTKFEDSVCDTNSNYTTAESTVIEEENSNNVESDAENYTNSFHGCTIPSTCVTIFPSQMDSDSYCVDGIGEENPLNVSEPQHVSNNKNNENENTADYYSPTVNSIEHIRMSQISEDYSFNACDEKNPLNATELSAMVINVQDSHYSRLIDSFPLTQDNCLPLDCSSSSDHKINLHFQTSIHENVKSEVSEDISNENDLDRTIMIHNDQAIDLSHNSNKLHSSGVESVSSKLPDSNYMDQERNREDYNVNQKEISGNVIANFIRNNDSRVHLVGKSNELFAELSLDETNKHDKFITSNTILYTNTTDNEPINLIKTIGSNNLSKDNDKNLKNTPNEMQFDTHHVKHTSNLITNNECILDLSGNKNLLENNECNKKCETNNIENSMQVDMTGVIMNSGLNVESECNLERKFNETNLNDVSQNMIKQKEPVSEESITRIEKTRTNNIIENSMQVDISTGLIMNSGLNVESECNLVCQLNETNLNNVSQNMAKRKEPVLEESIIRIEKTSMNNIIENSMQVDISTGLIMNSGLNVESDCNLARKLSETNLNDVSQNMTKQKEPVSEKSITRIDKTSINNVLLNGSSKVDISNFKSDEKYLGTQGQVEYCNINLSKNYNKENALSEEPWWVRKSVDEPLDPDFEEFVNTDVHYCINNKKFSTENKCTVPETYKISDKGPMYLLISDISNLKLSTYKTNYTQNPWYELYNHIFSTVMFYGSVVRVKKHVKNNLYTIDDGTGYINVLLNHKNKEMKSKINDLNNLEAELASAQVKGLPNMLPDSRHGSIAIECIEAMKRLMVIIRQRVNKSQREFEYGDKVHVIGFPKNTFETEKWVVYAFAMELDESFGQAELFWKRFIISMYEHIYLKKSKDN